ncbi:hypothetical protein TRFO_04886 [Tritrichomonas foetus]|uniref:Histidine kinase/HSP90-like ATPase domain-containing protein n=1 Tax=Tritrichomonas foetus TaxID=1144522 RepID=A0A1J4KAN0_9EUKA|nr:hypothetical protein TRFO_04886 [Tritrichomonas foetus]|eukprot:OHT08283.1 hypothetical protein TRFO_04886 [Tritrichomonas foetus]
MEKTPLCIAKVMNSLMDNMYVANVKNRLRALKTPSIPDQTRWIWELIQNAKDSIVNDPDRKEVCIEINANDELLTFRHNGSPFTGKAMCALLYKYSDEKESNPDSTGCYGTGFMTSLVLNRIVKVTTDLYEEDPNDPSQKHIVGFSATMHREGLTKDDLLQGLEEMRKSFDNTVKPDGHTTFEYKLYADQSRISRDRGFKSYQECGAQTLIFAPTIKSILFQCKEKVLKIKREPEEPLDQGLSLHPFEIKTESNTFKRQFIVVSYCEHNEELSNRMKCDRFLRINVALEVDDKFNTIVKPNCTCLYCTLPLIGSEEHQLPFILNSPDFEPDSERQSIILFGSDTEEHVTEKEQRIIITEAGINRIILKQGIKMFTRILTFLINNKGGNYHYFTNRLLSVPNIQNFDPEWYQLLFIQALHYHI